MAKKVAVIDDTREFVELVQRILGGEGYEVIPILGSLRAREIVKESKPDLILLDIMMPGRSGWELLDIIKMDPATRDIPVIITTGVRAFTARMGNKVFDVLRKPFEIDDFLGKVKAAIGEP